MDDNRQFFYAMAAGTAISGLLFWLAFWHGRILEAIAWGVTVSALCWFRYGGPRQWDHLHHHGTHWQIRAFQAFVVLMTLGLVALAVVVELEGLAPR